MSIKSLEYRFVLGYYWLSILLSLILYINEFIKLLPQADFTFGHMIFMLYVPIVGLWCLYKKYDFSYIFLGISLFYLLIQIKTVL